MILNERQYKITRKWALTFQAASLKSPPTGDDIDPRVGRLCREGEAAQAETLFGQMREYEALKAAGPGWCGGASSVEGIGLILIRARIAAGLTQKALAKKSGCHEQQVQRDEDGEYQSAALHRIALVAEVLGLNFAVTGGFATTPKGDTDHER